MNRHLHVVRSPSSWPPDGLRELGERIAEAATVIRRCDRVTPKEVAEAASLIVTAATRAEVLAVGRRDPVHPSMAAGSAHP